MLFRGEEHVNRWCEKFRLPRGATLPLDQVWRLSGPWYEDRLQEHWRPKTVEKIERIFAEAALTGDFWRVR
jgi:hypothetical protein